MTVIRDLYGKPSNRTAMLDAIAALNRPVTNGILFIPLSLADDPVRHDALVAKITEAMARPLTISGPAGLLPEIRFEDPT